MSASAPLDQVSERFLAALDKIATEIRQAPRLEDDQRAPEVDLLPTRRRSALADQLRKGADNLDAQGRHPVPTHRPNHAAVPPPAHAPDALELPRAWGPSKSPTIHHKLYGRVLSVVGSLATLQVRREGSDDLPFRVEVDIQAFEVPEQVVPDATFVGATTVTRGHTTTHLAIGPIPQPDEDDELTELESAFLASGSRGRP